MTGSRRTGVTRAAALLIALTFASQLLGLVRDAVIASVYGAGSALDAFLVAQGVMNLVLALIAGAMARSIVPPVSRATAVGDLDRAHRVTQTVLTLTLVVLLAGSVVMFAFADTVVSGLAPGFDSTTRDLAVELTRIVLAATVFVAATDILAAATQAHGRFFHSGVQGIPFNLVMITAAGVFGSRYGAEALAWGFVAGSALRFLVVLPPLRAAGLRLRPRLELRDDDVREVLHLMPPLLLTTAVANVNALVDRAVGSAQGDGVIASLSFGWRLVTLVDSLLVVTIAAALYPAFSTLGSAEQRGELRSMASRAVRTMTVLLVPASVFLLVAARPLVTLVYGRGEFGASAIDLTTTAVAAYAVSATALGLRVVASRAFFALGDTRTPVVIALVSMTINVVGDLTVGVAYGVVGLAASTSASLLIGAGLLLWQLHRRHRALSLDVALPTIARTLVAGSLAGLAGWATGLAESANGASTASLLVDGAALGAIVTGVFVAVLVLLRGGEPGELTRLLRDRLTRS